MLVYIFVFEEGKNSEIFLSNNYLVNHQTEMFVMKTPTMSMLSMCQKTINTDLEIAVALKAN